MNKKAKILIFSLLVLGMGAAAAYIFAYQDIPYYKTVRKIRVAQFTKSNIRITCEVVCFNPNKVGLAVSDSEFDVFANGKLVSHVRQNGGSNVNAESEFTIPLKVNFSPKKVFKVKEMLGSAFLSLKSKSIILRYSGAVKVLLAGQSISIPVTYEDAIKLK